MIILRKSVGWMESSWVPENSGIFSICIVRGGVAGRFGDGGVGVLAGVGGIRVSGATMTERSDVFSEGLYALSVEKESEDTDVGEDTVEALDDSSTASWDVLVPCVIVRVLGRVTKRPWTRGCDFQASVDCCGC